MAYVRIYYHREPKRLAPHVRYIARRPESDGLRGLGSAFRELRGDVDACVRLLEQHAARARVQAGSSTREGPFVRMLFTLPTDVAARVSQADARVTDGARLVLRDAVEATFRSVGRQLQGVYAIHFHAAQRAVHGHVHVDLSPLDSTGRPTFVTEQQRERFRAAWEREVVKAVERVEQRGREAPALASGATRDNRTAPKPTPTHATPGGGNARAGVGSGPPAARTATTPEASSGTRITAPGRRGTTHAPDAGATDTSTSWPSNDSDAAGARRRPYAPRRRHARYVPVLTEWLLGRSRTPLVDLFFRALVARTERRLARSRPALAVRFALGLPIPRVTVRPMTPLVRPRLLRIPYSPEISPTRLSGDLRATVKFPGYWS